MLKGVRGTTPESDGDRPQLRAGRSASSLNPGEPRHGSGPKLVFTALHTHRLRRPTPLASFSAKLHRSLDHPWWRPLGWIGRQPKMDQHSSDLRRITDQAQHSPPRTTGACEYVDQKRPAQECGPRVALRSWSSTLVFLRRFQGLLVRGPRRMAGEICSRLVVSWDEKLPFACRGC